MGAKLNLSSWSGPMKRHGHRSQARWLLLWTCAVLAVVHPAAWASEAPPPQGGNGNEAPVPTSASFASVEDPSRWLPGMAAASRGSYRAAASGWGGYDALAHGPVVGATAEAGLGSRLVVGVGVTYVVATTGGQPSTVRPAVAARLQVLEQDRHGLDASVSLGYGRDRYVDEQGLLVVSFASGFRYRRMTVLGNLGYGQDGEGDDHEGDLRLAGFYRVRGPFQLGFDGRIRKMLQTSDSKTLTLQGAPSLTITVGTVAAVTAGSWAFLVEAGLNSVRRGTTETGAMVVAAVGSVF